MATRNNFGSGLIFTQSSQVGPMLACNSEVSSEGKVIPGDKFLIIGLLLCVSIGFGVGKWVIPADRMVKIDKK